MAAAAAAVAAGYWVSACRGTDRVRPILSGEFHRVAHRGTGRAMVVRAADGTLRLVLERLRTTARPDLMVCLVEADDARDNESVLDARSICLGRPETKKRKQSFPLPREVDLSRFRAVTIWSEKYQVNFTTAPLAPARGLLHLCNPGQFLFAS